MWICQATFSLIDPATAGPDAAWTPSTHSVSRPSARCSATWCHWLSAYADGVVTCAVPFAVVISATRRFDAGSPRNHSCGAEFMPPIQSNACWPVVAPYRNHAV